MGSTEKQKTTSKLPEYKVKFIEALIASGALKFEGAEFTLKSKRSSPYFVNVGDVNAGSTTHVLARAYADAIAAADLKGKFDLIYGIPEKGVALAPTISTELFSAHGIESHWFFTRKLPKDHGEATIDNAKSRIVGSMPNQESRILLADDVLTTAGAKYDALKELDGLTGGRANVVGLIISVDRQEVDFAGRSAIQDFTEKTGIPVYSIINATDIHTYLEENTDCYSAAHLRIGRYMRVYGTEEARRPLLAAQLPQEPKIITANRSVIPACDVSSMDDFEELVKQTARIDGIGGYKIGFELGLRYGLPVVVATARRHTDKPLIYDHQKAGTDIPDTGKKFMELMTEAGISAVILFPQSGPETERAWICRAMENKLGVIVGGIMTHNAYMVSESGYISDEGALNMYRVAINAGVRNVVVPATKPAVMAAVNKIFEQAMIPPVFFAPGLGVQGGNFEEVTKALGENWHAIVGRDITGAKDRNYGEAATKVVSELIRQ